MQSGLRQCRVPRRRGVSPARARPFTRPCRRRRASWAKLWAFPWARAPEYRRSRTIRRQQPPGRRPALRLAGARGQRRDTAMQLGSGRLRQARCRVAQLVAVLDHVVVAQPPASRTRRMRCPRPDRSEQIGFPCVHGLVVRIAQAAVRPHDAPRGSPSASLGRPGRGAAHGYCGRRSSSGRRRRRCGRTSDTGRMFDASAETLVPWGTPGPVTMSGTRMSVSKAVCFPLASLCSPM